MTISLEEEARRLEDERDTGRIDWRLSFEVQLVELLPRLSEIQEFATRKRLLTPASSRALVKLARQELNLISREKTALRKLFEQMEENGFEFSD